MCDVSWKQTDGHVPGALPSKLDPAPGSALGKVLLQTLGGARRGGAGGPAVRSASWRSMGELFSPLSGSRPVALSRWPPRCPG